MNTIKLVSAVLLIGVQLITPTIGQFSQGAGQAIAGNSQNYPYGYYGQPLYGQSQGAQASATAVSSTVQNTQPGYYGPNQFTQSFQPEYSGPSIYPQPYNNGPCQSECMIGNIIYQIALLAQECQSPSYLQPIGYQQATNSFGYAPAQYQQFPQPIGYQQGATSATYASTQTQQNLQPTNNYYQPQSNYYQQPQYFPQQPYQATPYNSPQTYYQSDANSYGLSYDNANSGGSSDSFAVSDSNTYTDTTNPDGSEVTQQDSAFSLASADTSGGSPNNPNPSASAFSLSGTSSSTVIQPSNN